MSVKYHINTKTGRPNICRAQTPEACKYYDKETNTSPPHFENKEEARAYVEKELSKEYASKGGLSKKKKVEFVKPEFIEVEGYMGAKGWQGNKYKNSLSNKEIAKNVRKDLKDATQSGFLPKGLKYSVTSTRNSVNVRVHGFGNDSDEDLYYYDHTGTRKYKPEVKEALDKIESIHKSYNYRRSNSQYDYFDMGYYGGVSVISRYHQLSIQKYKEEKKANDRAKHLLSENPNLTKDELKKDKIYMDHIKEVRRFKELSDKENEKYGLIQEYTKRGEQPDWDEINKKLGFTS